MLELIPLRAEEEAWLPDFWWGGEAPDLAVHSLSNGDRWWVRSWRRPGRRWLAHWLVSPLKMLDLTAFHIDETEVSEAERYRARGGPNLHARPIRLPARWRSGEWAGPVRLAFVGRVRVGELELRALRLEAMGHAQWLGEGVGELALGPLDGPWTRWMSAWRGGERVLFADPGEAPELPELPEGADAPPAGLL